MAWCQTGIEPLFEPMVGYFTDTYMCNSVLISELWQTSQLMMMNCYRQTSNVRRTLVGNKIFDHADVVGASPAGAAPTASSFPT